MCIFLWTPAQKNREALHSCDFTTNGTPRMPRGPWTAAAWMAGCWKSKWRSMGDLIDLETRKRYLGQRAVIAARNGVPVAPNEVGAEAVSAVPAEAPSETPQKEKKTRREAQAQKKRKEVQVQKKKGAEAAAQNRRAGARAQRKKAVPAQQGNPPSNLPSRYLVPARNPNN